MDFIFIYFIICINYSYLVVAALVAACLIPPSPLFIFSLVLCNKLLARCKLVTV